MAVAANDACAGLVETRKAQSEYIYAVHALEPDEARSTGLQNARRQKK
jgi:hypothetical protein